jgi:hypothetical protein
LTQLLVIQTTVITVSIFVPVPLMDLVVISLERAGQLAYRSAFALFDPILLDYLPEGLPLPSIPPAANLL